MTKKKILVIGDATSIFVRDFICNFATCETVVDLISTTDALPVEKTQHQWNYKNSSVFKKSKMLGHLQLFNFLRKTISELDGTYSAVVIHYVFAFLYPHIDELAKLTHNITLVIWGSDYYRDRFPSSVLRRSMYAKANNIIFTNPRTKDEFKRTHRTAAKLHVARFGLPALDQIKALRSSGARRDVLCNVFNIPDDKILIMVGYNSNLSQRHDLIIDQLTLLPKKIKEKFHLIFPLGYGAKNVKSLIVNRITEKAGLNYSVLEKFYGFEDVAKLRLITDVLINIQLTDQFSGSMQETLYAGGCVIAGSWLPYDDIATYDKNKQFILLDNPIDLGAAIARFINSGGMRQVPVKSCMNEFISGVSSWNATLKDWDKAILSE